MAPLLCETINPEVPNSDTPEQITEKTFNNNNICVENNTTYQRKLKNQLNQLNQLNQQILKNQLNHNNSSDNLYDKFSLIN